jgi:hypothetical protein
MGNGKYSKRAQPELGTLGLGACFIPIQSLGLLLNVKTLCIISCFLEGDDNDDWQLHEQKRQQNHKGMERGGKRGFAEPLERSIANWLVGPSKKVKADSQGSFRQSG